MGYVFPGSIGELFVADCVIGYSVLMCVCREVHMRHTGYAATFLGIGLYCWILPRIEGRTYAWEGPDLGSESGSGLMNYRVRPQRILDFALAELGWLSRIDGLYLYSVYLKQTAVRILNTGCYINRAVSSNIRNWRRA